MQFTGDKLTDMRKKRGLTKGQLASKVGVGSASVTRWEKGLAEPHPATLKRLLKVLKCEFEDLYVEVVSVGTPT